MNTRYDTLEADLRKRSEALNTAENALADRLQQYGEKLKGFHDEFDKTLKALKKERDTALESQRRMPALGWVLAILLSIVVGFLCLKRSNGCEGYDAILHRIEQLPTKDDLKDLCPPSVDPVPICWYPAPQWSGCGQCCAHSATEPKRDRTVIYKPCDCKKNGGYQKEEKHTCSSVRRPNHCRAGTDHREPIVDHGPALSPSDSTMQGSQQSK